MTNCAGGSLVSPPIVELEALVYRTRSWRVGLITLRAPSCQTQSAIFINPGPASILQLVYTFRVLSS